MVFIVQPTKEGQTTQCPNCDTDIIARWTDYGGKFPDKLQWQTVDPRKAHYTKNGSCKSETPEQAENEASQSPISKGNSLDEDMRYVKNKIDLMFAMISEQYQEYTGRKNNATNN